MADCDPRGEILVTGRRGQGYEFAELVGLANRLWASPNESRLGGNGCVRCFTHCWRV